MIKRTMSIMLIICISISLLCSNAFASEKKIIIKDKLGDSVDLNSIKELINYQANTNFKAIEIMLKQIDKERSIKSKVPEIMTLSAYGDAYPYKQVNTADPRCYGYSLNQIGTYNPGDVGYYGGYFYSRPFNDSTIRQYFDVNTIAQCVLADLQRLYNRSSRIISSSTASINSYERRIAVRTGIHDFNGNGVIDLGLGEADYHFMLQNSDGSWAEKHGSQPSISDGNINPSTFSWNLGGYNNYYDSATIYIAIN